MKKLEIINKLFFVKNLLEKTGNILIFKEFGLTVSLYSPLKIIELGISDITNIQKISCETASSLTQKIKKLESLKLIIRKLDKNDKRKWIFELSKKGKSTIFEIEKKYEEIVEGLFKNFTENEEKIFYKKLNELEVKLKSKL